MDCQIFDLGLADYKRSWQFQKDIFLEVKSGLYPFAIILCQHRPVITLGRLAKRKNILASDEELQAKGIKVWEVERGGEVTYHGPGQLTVYPIFNLRYLQKDIHWFLRQLEKAVILSLADFGVSAGQCVGRTGVWWRDKKIASIGIAVKNWISFHGLSLNVKSGDLANFRLIRPCGLDIQMVSLEYAAGRAIEISEIKVSLLDKLKQILRAGLPVGRQGEEDEQSFIAAAGRRD
jgi:lipoate-protein ligase B